MGNKHRFLALCAAAGVALFAGCVSVRNSEGVTPPRALFSHVTGTVGVPNGSVDLEKVKSGTTRDSVVIHDWVFTGISASLVDMALQSAIEQGGLRKVHYADYEQTSYLGYVTLFTVTAYGE